MSNFKYYDTFKLKNMNRIRRITAKRQNQKFFKQQDQLYGYLLNINGYPLDKIQKEVVFSDDKYTMVIAAAGSGKTTTMIGKIKYLIKVKNINPQDILAISFTNESVNSLKLALEKNDIHNANVLTFHKLALSFINVKNVVDDNYLEYIIKEYIYSNYYTYKKNILCKAFKKSNYEQIVNDINQEARILLKAINRCHANDYKICDFIKAERRIIHKLFFKRLNLLSMLYIIMDIYYTYQEEKNSTNSFDFDDMIIEATDIVKHSKFNYKYIIVDEYQDTSLIRVNFLKEIIKKSNAKLLVVGDDYQSIYKFNGCDLNIFLGFNKYFPNPKIIKLQNTYRNCQELIQISQRFILKNPYQIKKKIKSTKSFKHPVKVIYYNKTNKNLKFKQLIEHLNNSDYFILGRNNYDIDTFSIDNLKYLTVHKSKGLEKDYVIIINLENSLYGFPNQVKELEIEKILFLNKQSFTFDEERRLFYVALTRAKKEVFLFVDKNNPSPFVKELLRDNKSIEILKKNSKMSSS